MTSIRYKALVPMGLLAGVLLTLIVIAVVALSQLMNINRSMAGRYYEIEEIRQIEVGVSKLVVPYISYLETRSNEQSIAAHHILDDLDSHVAGLRKMAVVNSEEGEVLLFVAKQLSEMRKHSSEFFSTKISNHTRQMSLLHEITREHFNALGVKLREYHDGEMKQVNDLVQRSQELQKMFQLAAIASAGVTFILFVISIWINNRILINPILNISKYTSGIADGKNEQRPAVISNDEIGCLSQDISRMAESLQSMYKRMEQLAYTDTLTGMMNRRAFEQIVERELEAGHRYKRKLGLVMLDIDHFKNINDTYGHAVGDEVLKYVAKVCNGVLRASDYCFRVGGEEFVLLLHEAASEHVGAVADRCRRALAEKPWTDGIHTIPVTASFGVSCAPRDGKVLADLIKAADKALYKAKSNGRNRIEGKCCAA